MLTSQRLPAHDMKNTAPGHGGLCGNSLRREFIQQVDARTVSEHLQNVFKSSELIEDSVIRKFRTTAADSESYLTSFYNLDVKA